MKKFFSEYRMEIVMILFFCLVVLLSVAEAKGDDIEWNNGTCAVGHAWELFSVDHSRNGGIHYFYQCECGDVIRLHSKS